ncbi:MAG: hypothetical protein ACTHQM_20240 [Thermoanaerobaculia bacterium]
MRVRIVFVIFLLATLAAHAQEFERVLIPVAVLDVRGAHDSVWRSELWAHLRADGVTILPLRIADAQPLRAGSQTVPIFLTAGSQAPGQFLRVTRELIDTVEFNLRVRDMSRTLETWGTEIPVVRESEFRRQPISLLPIPVDSNFRSMVRIYSPSENGGEVRIRITRIGTLSDHRVVHESVYTLAAPELPSPYTPSFLQLAIDDLAGNEPGVVRVDVEPIGELPIWAFASTTNNMTQHFTTIAPR